MCTEGRPWEDTVRRRRLHAQERDLRGTNSAGTLISDFQPPDCEPIRFCHLSPRGGILFRSPRRLIQLGTILPFQKKNEFFQ